jgi:UDP-glucose 4-epimerase
VNDKVILITGGTGSFGRVMVDRLLQVGCRQIRILSRDEEKQETMRSSLQDDRVKFYIGDVRDRRSVDTAMDGVDLVFHAAALKQVPSCEFFPMEAVRTNVIGSTNVIESAIALKVKSVVCLGTDKAVYPINAMGMTKALMEKVMQSVAAHAAGMNTTVSCVRYGNVMCSRGSVIPLFIRQIRQGQPLTVTEPAMTRFMLPLSEAVELVEFAFTHARPGDIFVRKSAASTILDLATAMRNVFGVETPIRTIGMRHGEKLHETLANVDELARAEDLGDYYRVCMDGRDLNYAKYFTEGNVEEASLVDYSSQTATRLTVPEIEQLLLEQPMVRQERDAFTASRGAG